MKTKPFSIELSDEAEIDFDKSFEFYYEDSPNVADIFFKRINLSFENIKQNPTTFPVAHKEVRKYVAKKIPFCNLLSSYRYCDQVIAIFHASRNPEIWNKRI